MPHAELGEVLLRVVDHAVRAERPGLLDVSGAAHRGHVGAERLGELNGERAHASGSAVDEHRLARLHLPLVAQGLECRDARHGHRRGLLERQVRRLPGEPVLAGERVLGPGRARDAEHLVARLQALDLPADGLDGSRQVGADGLILRPAHAVSDAREVRPADAVPLDRVDGRGVHAHEHLAVSDRRLVDVPQLEDIGPAVAFVEDRLHAGRCARGAVSIWQRQAWRRIHWTGEAPLPGCAPNEGGVVTETRRVLAGEAQGVARVDEVHGRASYAVSVQCKCTA